MNFGKLHCSTKVDSKDTWIVYIGLRKNSNSIRKYLASIGHFFKRELWTLEHMFLLKRGCSAVQRSITVRWIKGDGDKRIIVLVVQHAPNNFIWAWIEEGYALICYCRHKSTKAEQAKWQPTNFIRYSECAMYRSHLQNTYLGQKQRKAQIEKEQIWYPLPQQFR